MSMAASTGEIHVTRKPTSTILLFKYIDMYSSNSQLILEETARMERTANKEECAKAEERTAE